MKPAIQPRLLASCVTRMLFEWNRLLLNNEAPGAWFLTSESLYCLLATSQSVAPLPEMLASAQSRAGTNCSQSRVHERQHQCHFRHDKI